MKKLSALAIIAVFAISQLVAQADKVAGFWLTEKKTSQVQIYKTSDGKYHGKVSWLEEPNENGKPKVDDENPDPKLQNQPILGLNLLSGFRYNSSEKIWEGGTIYDPDNGKTYDCYMWFEDNSNVLYIKGYVLGMKFLGRSTIWAREQDRNNK